jgi:hypothetical protein
MSSLNNGTIHTLQTDCNVRYDRPLNIICPIYIYTLFGCMELGQESGIPEFGSEFRCLEWYSAPIPLVAPEFHS